MKKELNRIIGFIKNPQSVYSDTSVYLKTRLLFTCIILPIAGFIISGVLWQIVTVLKKANVFPLLETDYNSGRGIFFNMIITVIITPILEETIFRMPIKFLPKNRYFNFLIYLFLLIFGLVHFTNYQTNGTGYLFAILIVSPQITIGLLLSYIRISYGFWYAVISHAIYNLLGFSFLYIF